MAAIDGTSAAAFQQRIARVEDATAILPDLRKQVHALTNGMQLLQASAEQADETRRDIAQKVDRLIERVGDAALASARTDTQIATVVAGHIEQCRGDKAELHKLIDAQNDNSEAKHTENQSRLGKVERAVYVATGIGMALSFCIGLAVAFVEKVLK